MNNSNLYTVRYFMARHGAYKKPTPARIWNEDAPLSPTGIAEAQAASSTLKMLLAGTKPDIWMHSPFMRAQQTARLLDETAEWVVNDHLAPSPELVEEVERHGRFTSLAQIEAELPGHREKLRQRIISGLEREGSMPLIKKLEREGSDRRTIIVVGSGHQPFYGMAIGHYLNALDGETNVFDQSWQEPVKTGDIVGLEVDYLLRSDDSAAAVPYSYLEPTKCNITLYDGLSGEVLRQASAG